MDNTYPDFARERHNVRLGFASDEFNLFGMIGKPHSKWPFLVIVYNLLPWIVHETTLYHDVIPNSRQKKS